MSDIVERLREPLTMSKFLTAADLHAERVRQRKEAADELERLQAELREAREVMRDIVDGWDWWRADEYDRCQSVPGDAIDAARALLAK